MAFRLCLPRPSEASGADDGQVGDWSRFVDRIFGSQPALGESDPTGWHANSAKVPLESALTVRPARMLESLRRCLRSNPRLHQALTFVKPGVKIDRRSGQAKNDFLRFEEMARAGTVLESSCELHLPANPGLRFATSALLIAGSQLVERLGGKRRRGPGRCRLEVVDGDVNKALAHLADFQPPAWPTAHAQSQITAAPAGMNATADPWIIVPLTLHLNGPLAVSYRTVGNVVETLDFLPGSYLLPHVTRTLAALGTDPRPAIFRGDLCVLPATLEINGQRGLPAPMALFEEKGKQGFKEPATCLTNRLLEGDQGKPQLKQVREGYLRRGGSVNSPSALHRKVPKTVQTHNTVEDSSQRPTTEVGGVYTYEAIAPADEEQSVRLRSELRLRRSLVDRLKATDADWWQRLKGRVALGRSKKDDYGDVAIEPRPPADFSRLPAMVGNEVTVWLLSDTLLRDKQLRPAPTAATVAAELQRLLENEIAIEVRKSTDGKLNELTRVRRLDTWHVGWGLPRPSLVALQAGSCIVLSVAGAIDPVRLRELEASGIGERTAEGYGQVCFNDPLLTMLPSQWSILESDAGREASATNGVAPLVFAGDNGDPAFTYARLLETELWKQEIGRAAQALAADGHRRATVLAWKAGSKQGEPPMSQLGGLRAQLASLRARCARLATLSRYSGGSITSRPTRAAKTSGLIAPSTRPRICFAIAPRFGVS